MKKKCNPLDSLWSYDNTESCDTHLNETELKSIEQYRSILKAIGVHDEVIDQVITAYVACLTSNKLNNILIYPVSHTDKPAEAVEVLRKARALYQDFEVQVADTDQKVKFKDIIKFVSGTRLTSIDCDDWAEIWTTGGPLSDKDVLAQFFWKTLNMFAEQIRHMLAAYSAIDKGYYTFAHCFRDYDQTYLPIDEFIIRFCEPDRIQIDSQIMYRIGAFDIDYGYDEFDNPLPVKWSTTKWSTRMPYPIYVTEPVLAAVRQYCSNQILQLSIAEPDILNSLANNDFTGINQLFGYGYIPAKHNNCVIGDFKVELKNDRLIALEFRPARNC